MRALLAILICALFSIAGTARAELPAPLAKAVNDLVAKAIREQTVFLNCTATHPAEHAFAVRAWHDDVTKTAAALKKAGAGQAFIASFIERTAYPKLLKKRSPYADIIKMCRADSSWQRRLETTDFTMLQLVVPKLLREGKK